MVILLFYALPSLFFLFPCLIVSDYQHYKYRIISIVENAGLAVKVNRNLRQTELLPEISKTTTLIAPSSEIYSSM